MNIRSLLWKNPVIIKEIRTRMRARRAFIMLTIHLALLALLLAGAYLLFSASSSTGTLDERRIFGKIAFFITIGIELMVVSFIAPALTASSISSERERQTFDLLRVTLLSARALVGGKFASGLIFVFLLLFTAIPFLSPAFIFGGVLPEEIWISIIVLAVTAIGFCAIGVLLSSIFPRTLTATVLSYAFAILLVFGIPILVLLIVFLYEAVFTGFPINEPSRNFEVVLVIIGWFLMSINPLATIIGAEYILLDQQSAFTAQLPLSGGLTLQLPSPWIIFILIYLTLSSILLTRSVRLVKRKDR